MTTTNLAVRDGKPAPRCLFGRQHAWAATVSDEEHYVCISCGAEDDDRWYEEESE